MSILTPVEIPTDTEPMSSGSRPLRFITCGNVDDGKSTLIGRLLWDTKVVMDDQMDSLVKGSNKSNDGLVLPDFSLLLDGLQAEREQGITIDVAYRYFSTPKRSFIVADTPGHEQYTGNMATGASTADLAVILVDARSGIQEQTRRHTMIATLMGIKQLVLVINKMDLADYDHKCFENISDEFRELAALLDINTVTVIPTSATKGENVTVPGNDSMPWYSGSTLLEVLEQAKCENTGDEAFRFSVQRVSRPSEEFRGFQGTISGGTVKPGSKISILPSGENATITRIVTFDGDSQTASMGDAVTLVLNRKVDIARGDMIVAVNKPPLVSLNFEAKLITLTTRGLTPGKRYWLKSGSRSQRVSVHPYSMVDLKTQKWSEVDHLAKNTIAKVKLHFEETAIFDLYANNRMTGAFVLIDPDTFNTVAGGMIIYDINENTLKDHHVHDNLVTISLPESLARKLLKLDFVSSHLNDIHIVQTNTVSADHLIDRP